MAQLLKAVLLPLQILNSQENILMDKPKSTGHLMFYFFVEFSEFERNLILEC